VWERVGRGEDKGRWRKETLARFVNERSEVLRVA
jgi:hypothetical protein